jgi:hypothetical protein
MRDDDSTASALREIAVLEAELTRAAIGSCGSARSACAGRPKRALI